MKIYTKTGDLGKTRLVDGRECSKASLRVETYGAVDELNSFLGLCLSEISNLKSPALQSLGLELFLVQNQLFNLGSHLACESESTRQHLPSLHPEWIEKLENSIDQMTTHLPELKNFILPGGQTLASHLHVARTVARRAERLVVRLIEENGNNQPEINLSLVYLNRLSDYLFTAARFSNFKLGSEDQIWQKA